MNAGYVDSTLLNDNCQDSTVTISLQGHKERCEHSHCCCAACTLFDRCNKLTTAVKKARTSSSSLPFPKQLNGTSEGEKGEKHCVEARATLDLRAGAADEF